MKSTPVAIAFREVRHFKPDDWLHCEAIAVRGELHDWTIPAHRHEGLHQFQLLQQGQAEVLLDGVPHTVAAPVLLMVPPGCVHAFRYERGSTGQQVSVPTARLERALAEAPLLTVRLQMPLLVQGDAIRAAASHVTGLFAALAAEFDRSEPGRNEVLQAHLVLLATWVLRQTGEVAADESRRALRDTLVQRYRALLELHLRRHQPLAFYAQHLGVTSDHLSRSCRAAVGLSALDLLHERLLLEARCLLAFTQAPAAAVAQELGFDDPAYFSRFFTRRAGLSPLAFRSALKRGQAVPP